MLYNRFSDHLKQKYGSRVYKLPINIPATCPNRDGTKGFGGCIFCGEEGAGFELLNSEISVSDQLVKNLNFIGRKYGANKFIAYFQNYSNTYVPFEEFKKYIYEACVSDVVAVYISTRPDCIPDKYLQFLEEVKINNNIDIVLEIGLQTVNNDTLRFLRRGHLLSDFIDAVLRVKAYGLGCGAHYIIDLPMDSLEDVKEGARIISKLGVDQVKCHSMYILKNTILGDMYERGEIMPLELEDYIERAITFIENLGDKVVIQRLIGRAPEDRTLFCNWGMSWWKIRDMIEEKMSIEGRYQGSKALLKLL